MRINWELCVLSGRALSFSAWLRRRLPRCSTLPISKAKIEQLNAFYCSFFTTSSAPTTKECIFESLRYSSPQKAAPAKCLFADLNLGQAIHRLLACGNTSQILHMPFILLKERCRTLFQFRFSSFLSSVEGNRN